MVTKRTLAITSATLLTIVALVLFGWDVRRELVDPHVAAYTQAEYAKNPAEQCETRSEDFYANKAATGRGIQEVIAASCQAGIRGDYHGRLAKDGSAEDTQSAIDCAKQQISALKALQKVGVTAFDCPKR